MRVKATVRQFPREHSRLDCEKAEAIRQMSRRMAQARVAETFNVDPSTVSRVVRGKTHAECRGGGRASQR